MGDKSAIEWTDATWNPVMGCTKVSPGCAHCYIDRTPPFRVAHMKFHRPVDEVEGEDGEVEYVRPAISTTGVALMPDRLGQPLRWKRPRRIFVNSLSDLFHEAIPDEYIDRVFAAMALTPQHIYQILTKRPERMREYLLNPEIHRLGSNRVSDAARSFSLWPDAYEKGFLQTGEWPLPNVWLGVTAENQHWADERIPILLDTPAAVRFVSYEPALGPVALEGYLGDQVVMVETMREEMGIPVVTRNTIMDGISWVIVGGESGPKHRPFDPAWARSIVAQCRDAGVACFVKQLGGFRPGTALEDLPEDLRVREFPR